MLLLMWRALTQPSLSTFEQARAHANLGRAIIATLGIGIVTGVIGGIIDVLAVGESIVQVITLGIITPFRLVFALVVMNALWFIALRPFATGNFATQTFLTALISTPVNAIASLLLSIPTIGAVLAIAVTFYGVGVNVLALRVVYDQRISIIFLPVLAFIGGIIGLIAMSSISQ